MQSLPFRRNLKAIVFQWVGLVLRPLATNLTHGSLVCRLRDEQQLFLAVFQMARKCRAGDAQEFRGAALVALGLLMHGADVTEDGGGQ